MALVSSASPSGDRGVWGRKDLHREGDPSFRPSEDENLS